jgi:uncharacterized membrane protein
LRSQKYNRVACYSSKCVNERKTQASCEIEIYYRLYNNVINQLIRGKYNPSIPERKEIKELI